jgi:hypothetical protein
MDSAACTHTHEDTHTHGLCRLHAHICGHTHGLGRLHAHIWTGTHMDSAACMRTRMRTRTHGLGRPPALTHEPARTRSPPPPPLPPTARGPRLVQHVGDLVLERLDGVQQVPRPRVPHRDLAAHAAQLRVLLHAQVHAHDGGLVRHRAHVDQEGVLGVDLAGRGRGKGAVAGCGLRYIDGPSVRTCRQKPEKNQRWLFSLPPLRSFSASRHCARGVGRSATWNSRHSAARRGCTAGTSPAAACGTRAGRRAWAAPRCARTRA